VVVVQRILLNGLARSDYDMKEYSVLVNGDQVSKNT